MRNRAKIQSFNPPAMIAHDPFSMLVGFPARGTPSQGARKKRTTKKWRKSILFSARGKLSSLAGWRSKVSLLSDTTLTVLFWRFVFFFGKNGKCRARQSFSSVLLLSRNSVRAGRHLKVFRKRWFILTDDGHLYSFKTKTDSKPTETIDLRIFSSVKSSEETTNKANSFDVYSHDTTFTLLAETSKDKEGENLLPLC